MKSSFTITNLRFTQKILWLFLKFPKFFDFFLSQKKFEIWRTGPISRSSESTVCVAPENIICINYKLKITSETLSFFNFANWFFSAFQLYGPCCKKRDVFSGLHGPVCQFSRRDGINGNFSPRKKKTHGNCFKYQKTNQREQLLDSTPNCLINCALILSNSRVPGS